MRPRFTVLALLVSALAFVSVPAVAMAHGPRHNHGLTINATPDPTIAGEAVLIYGQLNGSNPGGQWINLYHHAQRDARIQPHRQDQDPAERLLRFPAR